jgi:hypothetical protein
LGCDSQRHRPPLLESRLVAHRGTSATRERQSSNDIRDRFHLAHTDSRLLFISCVLTRASNASWFYLLNQNGIVNRNVEKVFGSEVEQVSK